MKLPDTNVWLAFLITGHTFHRAARDWFAAQSGAGSILFCRATQQSVLRLLTTEQVMRPYGLAAMRNEET